MKRISLITIFLLAIAQLGYSQTADFTEGCAPLTVNFSAPDQVSYFWDFKDAASSVEQNPENVFTAPGTYSVELYVAQGGALVGTVDITVYPDIDVDISAGNDFGCIPLDVEFSSTISSDPAVIIESINWTVGDGGLGVGEAFMHTYTFGGIFDVSLDITTNLIQCNKTIIFENVVEAEDLSTEIVVPDMIPCTEPSTITISSGLQQDPRYTYFWNLGNGKTSAEFEPGEFTYNTFGDYEIWLRIESPSGCVDTSFTTISIGPAPAVLEYPSTVCVGETFTVINRTLANRSDWRFGEPLQRSFDRNLTTIFEEPGVQVITLLTSSTSDCIRETTFEITVEEPDPGFRIEPEFACSEETPQQLIANDSSLSTYTWNNENGSAVFDIPGIEEPRDELHINTADSLIMNLSVVSSAGCKADTTIKFDFRLAEAYFIPNQRVGFLTLDVIFSDFSESQFDIVRRYWIYDDNSDAELDPSVIEHTHTYSCGTYYPRLVIEDSFGCIDTSKAVEIRVICPFDDNTGEGIPYSPDVSDDLGTGGGDFIKCVTDTSFFSLTPGSLEYHILTDEGRVSHCWKDKIIPHQLNFPGEFPITLYREFDGLLLDSFTFETNLTVFGARSEILYEKSCDKNFEVNLTSNSLNADKLEWYYEGELISEAESLVYTFSEPGEHQISLLASNEEGGCAPDVDNVTIYVPELKADFLEPSEFICDSDLYTLDASLSVDVGASCYKGYKWIFENQRPRETGEAMLEHQFIRGDQDVSLVVEDINGCTDTITKRFTIYGVEASFNFDSTACFEYEKNFLDQSIADTTLVSWEWDFGSDEQNPTYTFDVADIDEDKMDTVSIQLIATDILGCTDTILQELTVIDPHFFINAQGGSRVCLGEEIIFNASDTADIIDQYDFFWEIDGVPQAEGIQVALVFNEPGEHTVTLVSVHKNGACTRTKDKVMNVLESPVPGFTADADTIDILCYPAQISFRSDPALTNGDFTFLWKFGEDDFSELANPSIEFGRGTHSVTQIVSNSEGCMDSITSFYTLVGPAGTFVQDKEVICIGEEVTFTLTDINNISSYNWNFGDGTEAVNINPVTHTYDSRPLGDSTIITLTLKSDEFGCDVTQEFPIFISEVAASIEDLGQICRGEIRLENASTGATKYEWDFGDGTTSTEVIPDKTYENAGTYTITLIASDDDNQCNSRDEITIEVAEEDEGIFLGMPNTFTPNNDEVNDNFRPAIREGSEEEINILVFRVYNRYGQLVYDSNNPEGWNGVFSGERAPPEVYAYYIELDIAGCDKKTRKGNVTLIR